MDWLVCTGLICNWVRFFLKPIYLLIVPLEQCCYISLWPNFIRMDRYSNCNNVQLCTWLLGNKLVNDWNLPINPVWVNNHFKYSDIKNWKSPRWDVLLGLKHKSRLKLNSVKRSESTDLVIPVLDCYFKVYPLVFFIQTNNTYSVWI